MPEVPLCPGCGCTMHPDEMKAEGWRCACGVTVETQAIPGRPNHFREITAYPKDYERTAGDQRLRA